MEFALIKDATNLDKYGDIPETIGATEDQAEIYCGTFEDGIMLCDKLLPSMYEKIDNCLLDLSDVDYFDAAKCAIIKKILDEKMKEACEPRLHELYTILYGYVNRAIELGTGVVIEL